MSGIREMASVAPFDSAAPLDGCDRLCRSRAFCAVRKCVPVRVPAMQLSLARQCNNIRLTHSEVRTFVPQ
jgi:hypothetical protein